MCSFMHDIIVDSDNCLLQRMNTTTEAGHDTAFDGLVVDGIMCEYRVVEVPNQVSRLKREQEHLY